MQELINKLTEKAGISADQAHKAIETIKDFVITCLPLQEIPQQNQNHLHHHPASWIRLAMLFREKRAKKWNHLPNRQQTRPKIFLKMPKKN